MKKKNLEQSSTQCSTQTKNLISKERQIESLRQNMLKQFKIPKRFQNKTFDNYDLECGNKQAFEKVMNYATDYKKRVKNGTWLILAGGYGLGKTHLALAAGKKSLKYYAEKKAEKSRSLNYIGLNPMKFISSSEMIQSIRDSYDSDQLDERQLMNSYKKTSLLIIDDLGTEKASEWQREKMYIVLNHRYNELLPTIITTNLSGSELTGHISPRVVERMIEAADSGKYMLNFKGKSYRRDNNG